MEKNYNKPKKNQEFEQEFHNLVPEFRISIKIHFCSVNSKLIKNE